MKYDSIIELAKERFKNARDADRAERAEIYDDIRFAVNDEGCQWPEDARRAREEDTPPRPCLVTNKIPEKIDQVEGEFRQMQPSVKIRPVDSFGDPKVATIIGGIIRHIQYDSTARSAYNHCHASVLYCGRGAWRYDVEDDVDDPFVRCIKINRIPNILSVIWDPFFKKEDRSDCRYFFITEEISELEYKNRYPGHEVGDWVHDDQSMTGWRTEKTVRIAEYWWKDRVDRKFYRIKKIGKNGTPIEVTVSEDGLKKLQDYDIIQEKTVKVDKVKWGIMNYEKFIEGPHVDWPSKYIPIVVESGKEVNIGGQFKSRGMVRFAKGPQQMLNFWNTADTEAIALTPKAPYIATAKQISDYQTQWDTANVKNYMYLLYEPDPRVPGSKPTREQPPQLSSAHAHKQSQMEHDIMSAMGIYNASLGDSGQEKSGRAIIARQRQSSIGSFTFTDKFNGALTYGTKIVLDLVPHVYDTERILRITGEDGKEMTVPINAVPNGQAMTEAGEVNEDLISYREDVSRYINDLTVGKFDAVVTVGPSYTTQRQEAAAMILDLIQSVPQIGMVTADILIKNLDIPGADQIIERVKKMVPIDIRGLDPGEEPPKQPPTDPAILVEMRKLVIDMRAEDRKEFEARVKAIKDLAEAEAKERGNQLQEYTTVMKLLREDVQATNKQNQMQGPPPGQQPPGDPGRI